MTPPTRAQPPRAARNVLANWGAFGVAVAINFYISPFIVHTLGDTGYGIWVMLASLVGYMGVLDLGVRSAVTRYVARFHAQTADGEAGRIASAALALFCALGALTVAVAAGLALVVTDVFNVPDSFATVARVVLVLGGFNIAIALLNGVFGGIVAALQRFDLLSGAEIAVEIVRATSVVIALNAGAGLIGLSVIQLGCTLLRTGYQFWLSRRLYPELGIDIRSWERPHLKQIFTFGIYSSLLHISATFVLSANTVVIGAFLPVSMVTFFAIGATLATHARSVMRAITQTVPPRVSSLQARDAPDELRRVSLRLGRLTTLVMLPITVTFMLRGGTFIGLWMGPRYADLSGRVLALLAVALSFAAARQVAMGTLVGLNRHKRLVPFYIVEALLNLGLSVLWIGSMGVMGVAWATALPNVVTSVLVVPWLLWTVVALKPGQVLTQYWLWPATAMIPFAVVTYLMDAHWTVSNVYVFFGQVLTALPVAFLGAWYVGLTRTERGWYAQRLVRPLRAAFGQA